MAWRAVRELGQLLALLALAILGPAGLLTALFVTATLGRWDLFALAIVAGVGGVTAWSLHQRMERARSTAMWLLAPVDAVARHDPVALTEALERFAALGPRHATAGPAVVFAAWVGGRRAAGASARWPDASAERVRELLDDARAVDGEPPRPLDERQTVQLYVASLQLALERRARRFDPVPGLALLGTVLFFSGRYRTAFAVLTAAHGERPVPALAYNAACAAVRAGRVDDAERWLAKVRGRVVTKAEMDADEDLASLRHTRAFASARRHQRPAPIRGRILQRAARRPGPEIRQAKRDTAIAGAGALAAGRQGR